MRIWKLLIGLFLVVIAVIIIFYTSKDNFQGLFSLSGPPEIVKIRYGSEKSGLLHDEAFIRILKKEYNLEIDGVKMGSLEMSAGGLQGLDGLWPSSELAAIVARNRHVGLQAKTQNIFNTPIVFYSWPDVAAALIEHGVVEKRQNTFYVVDMKKYLRMIIDKISWKDIGLPRQNGYVSIHSTDPGKSNSGFLLTGLMAVVLNNGNMVDAGTLEPHLITIRDIYTRLGFLENSTGILFDKYVKQGQGAFPVISGYESLIIEFYQTYPDYREQIKNSMRVLVPEPTVWSEHPFIALTKKGEKLMEALQDSAIQDRAWAGYGFRSGSLGVSNDMAILKDLGLPEKIQAVTPLPGPEIMERILEAMP